MANVRQQSTWILGECKDCCTECAGAETLCIHIEPLYSGQDLMGYPSRFLQLNNEYR